MDEIFIREIKIPLSIRAFTTKDYNGDYNIYINTDLSEDAKKSALQHEQIHVRRGDFYSNELATVLELSIKKDPRY